MRCPVKLSGDSDSSPMAVFPDFPQGVSFGADTAVALAHAADALATVIQGRIELRKAA